ERLYAAKGEDDLLKLVTFAKRPRLIELEERGGKLENLRVERHAVDAQAPAADDKPGAGSDLQSALQLAYGLFPHGYLKRIVLFTDGVETDGDLLAEVNRAKSFGAKLYAVPYRHPAPGEVALRTLTAPEKVDIGEPFDVLAQIYASRATRARARLYQGETLNGLDGV